MSFLKNRKALLYLSVYTVLVLMSGVFIGKWVDNEGKFGKRHHWKKYHYSHPQKMTDKFAQKLDLTDKQKGQLFTILETHKTSIQAMRKKMRGEFKLIRDQRVSDINAILSSEQQEKFAKMQKKYEKRHSKKKRYRRGEK